MRIFDCSFVITWVCASGFYLSHGAKESKPPRKCHAAMAMDVRGAALEFH